MPAVCEEAPEMSQLQHFLCFLYLVWVARGEECVEPVPARIVDSTPPPFPSTERLIRESSVIAKGYVKSINDLADARHKEALFMVFNALCFDRCIDQLMVKFVDDDDHNAGDGFLHYRFTKETEDYYLFLRREGNESTFRILDVKHENEFEQDLAVRYFKGLCGVNRVLNVLCCQVSGLFFPCGEYNNLACTIIFKWDDSGKILL